MLERKSLAERIESKVKLLNAAVDGAKQQKRFDRLTSELASGNRLAAFVMARILLEGNAIIQQNIPASIRILKDLSRRDSPYAAKALQEIYLSPQGSKYLASCIKSRSNDYKSMEEIFNIMVANIETTLANGEKGGAEIDYKSLYGKDGINLFIIMSFATYYALGQYNHTKLGGDNFDVNAEKSLRLYRLFDRLEEKYLEDKKKKHHNKEHNNHNQVEQEEFDEENLQIEGHGRSLLGKSQDSAEFGEEKNKELSTSVGYLTVAYLKYRIPEAAYGLAKLYMHKKTKDFPKEMAADLTNGKCIKNALMFFVEAAKLGCELDSEAMGFLCKNREEPGFIYQNHLFGPIIPAEYRIDDYLLILINKVVSDTIPGKEASKIDAFKEICSYLTPTYIGSAAEAMKALSRTFNFGKLRCQNVSKYKNFIECMTPYKSVFDIKNPENPDQTLYDVMQDKYKKSDHPRSNAKMDKIRTMDHNSPSINNSDQQQGNPPKVKARTSNGYAAFVVDEEDKLEVYNVSTKTGRG